MSQINPKQPDDPEEIQVSAAQKILDYFKTHPVGVAISVLLMFTFAYPKITHSVFKHFLDPVYANNELTAKEISGVKDEVKKKFERVDKHIEIQQIKMDINTKKDEINRRDWEKRTLQLDLGSFQKSDPRIKTTLEAISDSKEEIKKNKNELNILQEKLNTRRIELMKIQP